MSNFKCPMSKEDIIYNLKKGLDEERRALDLCRKLAGELHGDDSRAVGLIAVDEERHIKIVEELIAIVEKRFIRL